MKLAIALVCLLGAVACKSKETEKDKPAPGSASASGTGSASASGSGTASGTGSASASGSAAAGDHGKLLADAIALKDEMCACPDVACLDKTEEKMKVLGEGMDVDTMSPDLMSRLGALEEEVTTCALKIAEATPLTGENAAEAQKILVEFKALRDTICKCTDAACAETAAQAGGALDAKVQALYPPDDEGHYPPAFEAVMKSAAVCFGKLVPDP